MSFDSISANFDPTSHGLVRTVSYSNLDPLLRHAPVFDDRRVKDRLLANEVIVKNLRYYGLDLYDYISKNTYFFNMLVHQKLLEINLAYPICDNNIIAVNMADVQWVRWFLVSATTAMTDASIAIVARNKLCN